MNLKKIEKHFKNLNCETEINEGTLWISETSESIGDFDIICELEEMNIRWERYDDCGETKFAVDEGIIL